MDAEDLEWDFECECECNEDCDLITSEAEISDRRQRLSDSCARSAKIAGYYVRITTRHTTTDKGGNRQLSLIVHTHLDGRRKEGNDEPARTQTTDSKPTPSSLPSDTTYLPLSSSLPKAGKSGSGPARSTRCLCLSRSGSYRASLRPCNETSG